MKKTTFDFTESNYLCQNQNFSLMSVEVIKMEISKLSRSQKVEVMHYLIDEFDEGKEEFILTEELKKELDRREANLKNGQSKLLTWEAVKANVEQRKNNS